jgi:hypothetical protein
MFGRFQTCGARVLAAIVVLVCFASVIPSPASAASPDEDYKKLPGYVDFESVVGDMEATVEVYLKGSLLVLAREAVKTDDPELGELLSKIDYIHVQVFPMEGRFAKQLEQKTAEIAKLLDKKGWELTVRVREDEEQVHVYVLPGKKDDIAGLVVMAVEEGDEAVFVNIVGSINPAEIGRIGRTFHIDSIDVPIKVEVEGDAKVTVSESEKKHED